MFYYMDQPSTPSFPIWLVKTKSDNIARSFETDLGRWTLVVAVISVDAFWLSQIWPVISRIWDEVFPGSTVLSDSEQSKLGSSNQETFPSASKNTGVVLVPCLRMEVCTYNYFQWCQYFWSHWVSFVATGKFSVRVTKITSRIGVSWTHSLPFYFTYFISMNYGHTIKRV